jgi:gas vesicle protein
MANERNGGQGVAWFVAGIGIGALVGILYAPKSGRETRDDLAHGARTSSDYLRTRSKDAARQVGALVDKGKVQVSEYVDRGREYVDRGRAQWEEFVKRGKGMAADQTSHMGAAVDAGREAYRSATTEHE